MPQINDSLKADIEQFVTQRLKSYQEIDRIFIEQKDENVFRVVVIIKEVNPTFERKVYELKNEIRDKFRVPSNFAVISDTSSTAAIINP